MIKKFNEFVSESTYVDKNSVKNYKQHFGKPFVVNSDLNITDEDLVNGKLPDISQWEIKGDFNCSYCYNLTSLEGAPEEVGKSFDCSYCTNLTSLQGAPKTVGGNFDYMGCKKITNEIGLPANIGGKIFK